MVLLLPLPLNHSFALRVLRAVLYSGATLVLQNGFTFAKEVENNIEAYHCTGMACVPTSYEVMKSQMQDMLVPVLSKLSFMEFGAGYWNNPVTTAETLVDGWLVTGDMAYMDEDGNVYMLGRADDIINVGGEKVSPIEVENIACQYEFVKECACIGVADPEGVTG